MHESSRHPHVPTSTKLSQPDCQEGGAPPVAPRSPPSESISTWMGVFGGFVSYSSTGQGIV